MESRREDSDAEEAVIRSLVRNSAILNLSLFTDIFFQDSSNGIQFPQAKILGTPTTGQKNAGIFPNTLPKAHQSSTN